jgi:hypothetical protein
MQVTFTNLRRARPLLGTADEGRHDLRHAGSPPLAHYRASAIFVSADGDAHHPTGREQDTMRLKSAFRVALYGIFALLFISGWCGCWPTK